MNLQFYKCYTRKRNEECLFENIGIKDCDEKNSLMFRTKLYHSE